jgi:hypothetical protein
MAPVLLLFWRAAGERLAMGLCSRALARSKGEYKWQEAKNPRRRQLT